MALVSGQSVCNVCNEVFENDEKMVNSNGALYHENCFVCAQCFRPFEDGVFYEFDGRQYCEYDFQQLYAPCCRGCKEYIIGRVIKAVNSNWHPDCFRCEICDDVLADAGFVKNAGRALCKRCNANEKSKGGRFMCHKCHTYIEEGKHIVYMGDPVHPWHYNCYECGKELDETCRKRNNELFCLRCHDKMGIPICGACRQPIEDERVVNAIGKQWHVDHFCCAKCEKPFYGNRHYERNGLAYCETHFNQLFGDLCFICNRAITRDVVTALNKCFCVQHFTCNGCNMKLTLKSKFQEIDMKPLCLRCHEKLPKELRKRLKKPEPVPQEVLTVLSQSTVEEHLKESSSLLPYRCYKTWLEVALNHGLLGSEATRYSCSNFRNLQSGALQFLSSLCTHFTEKSLLRNNIVETTFRFSPKVMLGPAELSTPLLEKKS